jgi:hypothetical protein
MKQNTILFITVFLLIFYVSNLYVESNAQSFEINDSRTIHLNFSTIFKKEPKYVFYFLKHLDRWYLQLTPDHKKFVLLNSKELSIGTKIENEEESQGQYLKHLYTVTQFDENAGVFQMVSPATRVVVGKFFRMQNKTILTIKVKDNKDGTYLMTSDLDLIFASKSDKAKAVSFKADKIWQEHMNEEMTKAITIIESLDNIDRP